MAALNPDTGTIVEASKPSTENKISLDEIKTQRTKEATKQKLEAQKQTREEAEASVTQQAAAQTASESIRVDAQRAGATRALEDLATAVIPSPEDINKVAEIVAKNDEQILNNALKKYDISTETLEIRAKRIAGRLDQADQAVFLNGANPNIDLKVVALAEILEERGLTITDKIDLATKDGLNDNAAKEAVRAEVADQIKAEIKNYKGKPEGLIYQIIANHQDPDNPQKIVSGDNIVEGDLLALGIKLEDFNRALKEAEAAGKNITDSNIRGDVLKALIRERYTEALIQKAAEGVANASDDEVTPKDNTLSEAEQKKKQKELADKRRAMAEEVSGNYDLAMEKIKRVEEVLKLRDKVVRAALRLKPEGIEARKIALKDEINKLNNDISNKEVEQRKLEDNIAGAVGNLTESERTELGRQKRKLQELNSEIKQFKDDKDSLLFEEDILDEAEEIYKDAQGDDPETKKVAQKAIDQATNEKNPEEYGQELVSEFKKARDNEILNLIEEQKAGSILSDELKDALSDPAKFRDILRIAKKERRKGFARTLMMIITALLGPVALQVLDFKS